MYLKMIKHVLAAFMIVSVLATQGCVTTTVNPDGSAQVSAPDYDMIQLLSTASIAAWAASQKEGIRPQDAEALAAIIDSIESFHQDGSPIVESDWSAAVAVQVPKRYQALSMVLVVIVQSQLAKYGVMDQVPTPDSVGGKIMKAIVDGAKMGLAPYLPQTSVTIWEDRTVYTYEA